ncbi:MAG: hypothetical protein ACOX6J_05570 [Oscillospiraceae bacterium]|jgi:hypothetical protein
MEDKENVLKEEETAQPEPAPKEEVDEKAEKAEEAVEAPAQDVPEGSDSGASEAAQQAKEFAGKAYDKAKEYSSVAYEKGKATATNVYNKGLEYAETAGKYIGQTARNIRDATRLSINRSNEKAALKRSYEDLGKLYYEVMADKAEGEFLVCCNNIKASLEKIDTLTEQLNRIKNNGYEAVENPGENKKEEEPAEEMNEIEKAAAQSDDKK